MDFQTIKEGNITSPQGFHATGVASGIKKEGALDLGLIFCERPAKSAAVYTTNAFQAAPLKITQESLGVDGHLQAVIVNSGNANACTGEQGKRDAYRIREEVSKHLSIREEQIAMASTGVIGESLPMDRMIHGIKHLQPVKQGATSFAKSILTTDTVIKTVAVEVMIGKHQVKIAGCAKGSGMIKPNMATMLAFITTDAHITSPVLQYLLQQVTDQTFNMIAVDGDCSTNDMVLAMASGYVDHPPLHPQSNDWPRFVAAFHYVCQSLAKQLARDGEGATRLIETHVVGAVDTEQAKKVAKAVIGSNLVKTAVFGSDANWGRVICAVGYGDPSVSPDHVNLSIGNIELVKNSQQIPFDESQVVHELKKETVVIGIDLQQGDASATAWGCDLTYDYIKINASYRT